MSKELPPSPHKENKDSFIESVESKVRFLSDLHNFLLNDEIMKSLSKEDFTNELKNRFSLLIEGTDYSDQYSELLILENKISEISKSIKSKEVILSQDEVLEKRKEKSELKEKTKTMLSDEEFGFLFRVSEYIKYIISIKNKYDEYEKYGEISDKELLDKCAEFLSEHIRNKNYGNRKYSIDFRKMISRVELNGLNVHIVLDKKARSRSAFGTLEGRHYRHTPIVISYEDSHEYVYHHEKNHLVYQVLEDHRIMYRNQFIINLVNILKSHGKSEGRLIENITETSLIDSAILFINRYKNLLNGEILADLEGIFKNRRIYGFYNHFLNTLAELEELENKKNIIDPETFEKIKPAIKNLDDSINKKIRDIGYIVYVANQFNIIDETKSAYILFKGDISKIKRYLRHKIGENEYDNLPKNAPYDKRIFKTPMEESIQSKIDDLFKDSDDGKNDNLLE